MFTTLNKEARKFSSLRGSVITIEGLIGIGKTTLGRAIVNYLTTIGLNARFYPEYVNEEFLKTYIMNMKKYSFSFQLFMLEKRIEIYREAQQYAATGGIAIIDRSINGDYTFALMQHQKGFFDDEEWEVYLSILRKESIPEPHLTLYLICSPETSMRRVGKRGIQSEISGYTVEYMRELSAAYNVSMKTVQHPLVTVDWEFDVGVDEDVVTEVLKKIKSELLKM